MDKSKAGFIAAAAVLVAAAAGLGFFAWKQFGKAAEARSDRDASASALDRIYRQEIFPNNENVEALAGVLEEFSQGREAMTNMLAKSNINKAAPGEISPSAFQSKLSAGIRKFHADAPLVDGRKSVADNFAFGFEAYYGKDAMPKEEEVPLLVQQLGMTALLVREIYGAQVSQLTKIEREARDSETIAMLQASGRGGRRDAEAEQEEDPRARKQKKGKKADSESAPLFTGQKMALEFTARQHALIDLLNRLNAMPRPFVVVKSVSAKKTGDDLRKPPAQETPAAESQSRRDRRADNERSERRSRRSRRGQNEERDEEPEAPATPAAAAKPAELPAEMRVVSGPDVDPPLSVRLELEIFNFGEENN